PPPTGSRAGRTAMPRPLPPLVSRSGMPDFAGGTNLRLYAKLVPMPGRKADTSRRESRLEDIKNAALKEFYQRGYAATDLRAIAREVGLHVSSLYNYISSKQQLLYLIATQYVEDSTRSLTEAIAGIADPVERLRSAIRS